MASYNIENDSIGGGGLGGIGGFGGGSWGLLILIFLFFAIFSGGGLFGRREHEEHEGKCRGISNCEVDKDVVTSRDAGIIEQKNIYEKNLERKILERDMVIQEQKNQLFLNAQFGELTENMNAKFNMLEREIEKRPAAVPHFAKTVDACVQPQMNCFDRFRDNDRGRDRDRDCGGCWN